MIAGSTRTGSLVGTVAALAAIGGTAMAAWAGYDIVARDLQARDLVERLRRLREAAGLYARAHYSAVLRQAGTGTSEIPLAELIADGLLPADFATGNGARSWLVLVRRTPTAGVPVPGLIDGQLELLVRSTGGASLPDARAAWVASLVGGGGAVLSTDPAMLAGAYGTWRMPVADWATGAIAAPAPGTVAAMLVLHPGEMQIEYLYRYRVPGPGNERFNRMERDIDFAPDRAYQIRNVSTVRAGALRIRDTRAGAASYGACDGPDLAMLTRAGGGVPMVCNQTYPPLQWSPWLLLGGAGNIPADCAAGEVLQATGGGFRCAALPPPAPTNCAAQSLAWGGACTGTVPTRAIGLSAYVGNLTAGYDGGVTASCMAAGWQMDNPSCAPQAVPTPYCGYYGVPMPAGTCPTYCPSAYGYIPENAYCPPRPDQSCPDGSYVPYGDACPTIPTNPQPATPCTPLFEWGSCPGIAQAYQYPASGFEPNCSYGLKQVSALCPAETGASCPGSCWPTQGHSGASVPGAWSCVPDSILCGGPCVSPSDLRC